LPSSSATAETDDVSYR